MMEDSPLVGKSFLKDLVLERRKKIFDAIISKKPGKIPVIMVPIDNKSNDGEERFMVDPERNLTHLLVEFRKRTYVDSYEAIFLTMDNKFSPPLGSTMGTLYNLHKSNDGFLYIGYSREKVYG